MTPAEALEQVRALHVEGDFGCPNPLHGCNEFYYRGNYCADSGTSCEACGEAYPCPTIAILDAVTPDSGDPIPRYAQLDIWMALFGSESSEKYETYRDEHGFATTWAVLCDQIRKRRPATPERTEQEREAAVERVAEAFKAAWHEADEQGLDGQRTVTAMRRAIAAYEARA